MPPCKRDQRMNSLGFYQHRKKTARQSKMTVSVLLSCLLVCCSMVCGVMGIPPPDQPPAPCPSICICHTAPLHSAPFVHTWLREGAQQQQYRPRPPQGENEVVDASGEAAAGGGVADDANVDVFVHGIHATCALYPGTNLTALAAALPTDTMVLILMQAAGCNYTAIEGDDLAPLTSLRALHIQGFAHYRRSQVSGHTPKTSEDLDSLNKQINEGKAETDEIDGRYARSLNMALTDDVLNPLVNLEVLDLQYVRLVAKADAQRPRRHIWGPISTTTMIDMPLPSFLRYADDLDVLKLPPNREMKYVLEQEQERENINENDDEFDGYESDYYNVEDYPINNINEEISVVLLNSTEKEDAVPYNVYKSDTEEYFAPFIAQHALKYLRIAHAYLDKLGPELLGGLANLHTFTLENNHIRVLPPIVFAPTPNLKHLSIAKNYLFSLDSKSLFGLPKLETLDLEHNRLSILGPASFPHLPKLTTLRLLGNPLQHILPDTFFLTNATETLLIGSPLITTQIHEDAFRQLSNLKVLEIRNLSSKSFHSALFNGISQLEDLTLHGAISDIDYDTFTEMPQLKSLNISHCSLSRISVDAFFGLSKLIRLDLSYNNLVELNPGTFDHFSSLSELYLHHNYLKTLPVGIFIPLGLKLVQLNHNPWHCSCNLLQLQPILTNRVLEQSYRICRYDSKLATVCDETAERLVFDVRVAPKCSTPIQFINQDVYTVSHRYLKCSKSSWDPLIYGEDLQLDTTNTDKIVKITKPDSSQLSTIDDYDSDQLDENDGLSEASNWRHLADFTPVPIAPLDLLNIAEGQMLEEAKQETTTVRNVVTNPMLLQDGTTTLTKEEQKERMALTMEQYRASKQPIKEQLRLDRAKQMKLRLNQLKWSSRKLLVT